MLNDIDFDWMIYQYAISDMVREKATATLVEAPLKTDSMFPATFLRLRKLAYVLVSDVKI